MAMTPEARSALRTTIRSLRQRLLTDLHAETERVYRLAVRSRDTGLDDTGRKRRARLEGWIDEQHRAGGTGEDVTATARTKEDYRRDAEKQAAYTLLNRFVILRLMEEPASNGVPLRAPAVAKGGWESEAYLAFRDIGKALVQGDDTEGYRFLLQLVFEDLAIDLPGLYGPAGVADLIPVSAHTLRHVVEALDAPELATCWGDDMTLGWVYQYWNDPEREALDAKLHAGSKLQPHEIAGKTQMFTERYMVDWLLQNSLGPMWLAICHKHGWTPQVEADGTLERLEARRVEWRAKRDKGEVPLTALMPLQTDAERRWAYYVPQPIPEDAVEHAAQSVRDLRILDPAVGSGHFLVVAMDLLVALYREEARHRGVAEQPGWSDGDAVERILSHNLYGIDLDPRAVQIAAAALWLKARQTASAARPESLNLVASNLRLGGLPEDDPALVELRNRVERETGIPGELTDTIVHALRGADYLGSLLRVNNAIDAAITSHEEAVVAQFAPQQGELYQPTPEQQAHIAFEAAATRHSLVERLEEFLENHTSADDLGLRLRGEQLASGVRFARMLKEGTYHLVVANPPYQRTSKMHSATYIEHAYPLGKTDLFAAFLLRGLELVRQGGWSAMLTMRSWMFIKSYAHLRGDLLSRTSLQAIGDFDRGAFEEIPDEVVSVAASVWRKGTGSTAIAVCPTPRSDRSRDGERTARKRAATLCQVGRHDFAPYALKRVLSWPVCYWWTEAEIGEYEAVQKLSDFGGCREGLGTRDDHRFLRRPWEIAPHHLSTVRPYPSELSTRQAFWVPFIKGAQGKKWMEPLDAVVRWRYWGAEIANFARSRYGRGASYYFRRGIAVSTMGYDFSARVHRFPSVFGDAGVSVFTTDLENTLCVMNSSRGRQVLESLNPSTSFKVNDVNRLPLFPIHHAESVVRLLDASFAHHEASREPSFEFRRPGPSYWRAAQIWAQEVVDNPRIESLPSFDAAYEVGAVTDHLSFGVGVAVGRFGRNGEGTLDLLEGENERGLPAGILFLDNTLEKEDWRDGLGHPAAAQLREAWVTHASAIPTNRQSLREWLTLDFFRVHRGMYENRPIYWPLSSTRKTFVAWVNIHRFTDQTLRILLADYLINPTLKRIDGELSDLRRALDMRERRDGRVAEREYDKLVRARDELLEFIAKVEQCADRGAPPTDAECPEREQDARYAPDLDDGVMINSAALWPLLEPQWRDPKKWWKELSKGAGRKNYDWSHLAMGHWPTRVDDQCRKDASFGVAHGCFWRYHPSRAWAWELRIQDEIGPDFRIEEAPYRPGGRDVGDAGDGPHRDGWLREHPQEALAAVEREAIRRMRKRGEPGTLFSMSVIEVGLWSAIPHDVWDMELRLSERLGAEFRLVSPEEPSARAEFESAHPDLVEQRAALLNSLVTTRNLLDETDDEEADEEDDDEASDESEASESDEP